MPEDCGPGVFIMTAVSIYVCEQVRGVQAFYADLYPPTWVDRPIRDHLEEQAARLSEGHATGDPAAAVQLQNWLPRMVGAPVDFVLRSEVTGDDARHAIARDHGYENWDQVTTAAGTPNREFESAVDAVVSGHLTSLRRMFAANPALTRASSSYGHRATLLHYVAANAVEIRRQQIPANAVDVAQVLIGAGADVNAKAWMYGEWVGPLPMVATSAHPADAGVAPQLMKVLVDAGAESN